MRHGFALRPLSFLLYVKFINHAEAYGLFLYADYPGVVYEHKDVKEIDQNLSKIFLISSTGLWIIS